MYSEDYQKRMKGVDLCDQMVGYFLLNHRSWKWWRHIFFHMMLVCVHNAYIVAKHHDAVRAKSVTGLSFRISRRPSPMDSSQVSNEARIQGASPHTTLKHDIEKIFQKRTCKVCARKASARKRQGVTRFGHVQCHIPCYPKCIVEHIRHHNAIMNNPESEHE